MVSRSIYFHTTIDARCLALTMTQATLKSLVATSRSTAYRNDDILPLPENRRTWTKGTFVLFWISTGK